MEKYLHRQSLTPQTLFERLIGLEMWSIGRAANLVWIQIGKKKRIRVQSRRGDRRSRTVGTYALHLQTAFRFSNQNETLVAKRDIYLKGGNNPYENEFDWTKSRDTRFEQQIKGLLKPPLVIIGVSANDAGGFSLQCSKGIKLEVMPDDSTSYEHWRLLEFNVAHYVLEGSRLEIHDEYEGRRRK